MDEYADAQEPASAGTAKGGRTAKGGASGVKKEKAPKTKSTKVKATGSKARGGKTGKDSGE